MLVLALAVPAAAEGRTGPCRVDGTGGPRCHVFTGKVTSVADGDGLYARVRRDGVRGRVLVRMTGIQAMELTRYSHTPSRRRGACHAREATRALERLVSRARGRVRLAAQDLRRTDRGRRVRRHVALRMGGRWVDAGAELLAAGHVLWLPNGGESAWNASYRDLSRAAAAGGSNLFDRAYCGTGPGPADAVELAVNFDAEGSDGRNVNGEYVRVRNASGSALALGGWWIRDSALRRFTFPSGTTLEAGGVVTMRVGPGRDSGSTFHWGQPRPVFENSGDGAYLFDPQGDLRAWQIYG